MGHDECGRMRISADRDPIFDLAKFGRVGDTTRDEPALGGVGVAVGVESGLSPDEVVHGALRSGLHCGQGW